MKGIDWGVQRAKTKEWGDGREKKWITHKWLLKVRPYRKRGSVQTRERRQYPKKKKKYHASDKKRIGGEKKKDSTVCCVFGGVYTRGS